MDNPYLVDRVKHFQEPELVKRPSIDIEEFFEINDGNKSEIIDLDQNCKD